VRPITKKAIYVIFAVVVVLLALGALPGLLKSGDPYYLTATAATPAGNATPFNASEVTGNRFPYITAALERASAGEPGRSDPYWRGPVGFKGAFTHSPFDEENALSRQYPNASADGGVYTSHDGTVYRLTIVQEAEG
jgi:hypothetical protein